jgi:hypothetical protein
MYLIVGVGWTRISSIDSLSPKRLLVLLIHLDGVLDEGILAQRFRQLGGLDDNAEIEALAQQLHGIFDGWLQAILNIIREVPLTSIIGW